MTTSPSPTLVEHFAALDDPRIDRTKLHPLLSIITISICAVISGAESWDDIEQFGEAKEEWLASFLDLPHGIPSHDTFNRVFAALDPIQFQQCFQSWMEAVRAILPNEVIALDGKTVRGSHDATGEGAIHLVSAWATANRLVLAQVTVDAKSMRLPLCPTSCGNWPLLAVSSRLMPWGVNERLRSRSSSKEVTTSWASKATKGHWSRMSS